MKAIASLNLTRDRAEFKVTGDGAEIQGKLSNLSLHNQRSVFRVSNVAKVVNQ